MDSCAFAATGRLRLSQSYPESTVSVMKVLIVDNKDSFTFNLSQLVAKVAACEPLVIDNTEAHWRDLVATHGIGAIIISPGPGTPERLADFGICREVILEANLPLLGVCLGHQGLGYAYGAEVVRAPTPMHGRISRVTHDGSALFEGIPPSFSVVRYHSLCLQEESIPPCLKLAASSSDGVPMAVRHLRHPQFGVQFHPESISAEIRRATGPELPPHRSGLRDAPSPGPVLPVATWHAPTRKRPTQTDYEFRVVSRSLDRWIEPQAVFERLFARREHSYWLDSSAVIPGYSRFSIMGDATGPGASLLVYRTQERTLETYRRGKVRRKRIDSLLPELRRRLARAVELDSSLPFPFQTGLVGFLGYEMRNEFGCPTSRDSALPDAAFFDSDRCIVFDHHARRMFLIARVAASSSDAEAAAWFDGIASALANAGPARERLRTVGVPIVARLADGPKRYRRKILLCQDELAAGESYQICLSSEFTVNCGVKPFDAYRQLRALNPAPYSAYLQFGQFAVLSSSPERFLCVSPDRTISAKPIKGTCPRDGDPEVDSTLAHWLRNDEKCRSENLMIVDLLRNDIGRVALTASVQVPTLMDVESYATVHQLVSTVTGHLRKGRDCLDCLAAAFPGGSMTGAPKLRTMSIINRLERRARGPYSGAIGFLSHGDRMDLSIVIRTIVMSGSRATVASGGGIVALSDPRSEFDEMVLKAKAPLRALAAASAGDSNAWEIRYSTL